MRRESDKPSARIQQAARAYISGVEEKDERAAEHASYKFLLLAYYEDYKGWWLLILSMIVEPHTEFVLTTAIVSAACEAGAKSPPPAEMGSAACMPDAGPSRQKIEPTSDVLKRLAACAPHEYRPLMPDHYLRHVAISAVEGRLSDGDDL